MIQYCLIWQEMVKKSLPLATVSAATVSLKDKYYRDKHCPCKKDFVQLSFGTDEHPVTFV